MPYAADSGQRRLRALYIQDYLTPSLGLVFFCGLARPFLHAFVPPFYLRVRGVIFLPCTLVILAFLSFLFSRWLVYFLGSSCVVQSEWLQRILTLSAKTGMSTVAELNSSNSRHRGKGEAAWSVCARGGERGRGSHLVHVVVDTPPPGVIDCHVVGVTQSLPIQRLLQPPMQVLCANSR